LVIGIPFPVTTFFRDPPAWEAMQPAIDQLLRTCNGAMRAWVTACSTGEEAYSLAMLLTERVEALGVPSRFRVFATDASPQLVSRATVGLFTRDAVKALGAVRLERFFLVLHGRAGSRS
jgi:two-component system CheB/CheR fusion protein